MVSGFGSTFTFPLGSSLPLGQRLKCLWDGVAMLVWRGLTPADDLTGALLFFLIPILSGHIEEGAHSTAPMRESIVSGGGSVTVVWMQGSQARVRPGLAYLQ